MANTSIKTPKLNVSNIKSPLTGGGSDLGNVGQGGTSKIGTLAKIVRKNRISINSLIKSQETQDRKIKSQETQDRKITILKNIAQTRQQNIGQKLPGSDKGDIEKSLAETNQILVKIQQELMRSSALRSKEEKAKSDRAKRGASRAKLSAEESQLEKSSKRIKKSVGEKADDALEPVKGIFGRIMDFIGTLALGIASNAIFEWLKDENNIQKINEWFGWIKDNWKWMAVAVGAIALLPVVSTISGLIGPVGMIVGLLAKAVPLMVGLLLNPLFLKAMLAVGAGILIYKGGEFLLKKARDLVTGGEDFSAAHSQLDQQLADAGMDKGGRTARGRGRAASKKGITGRNEDQEKIFQEVKKKREALYALKDEMNAEIKEKQSKLEIIPTPRGRKKQGYVNPNEQARKKVDMEVREDYKTKISDIITPTKIEERKMGGPVTAGNPYIVGERGPEIFMPNVNGSVVNNYRTEKIYQMISSGGRGRGKINFVNLPPITNQLPPPELPNMSGGEETEVPDISSTNMADPYRQLGPILYGITV